MSFFFENYVIWQLYNLTYDSDELYYVSGITVLSFMLPPMQLNGSQSDSNSLVNSVTHLVHTPPNNNGHLSTV